MSQLQIYADDPVKPVCQQRYSRGEDIATQLASIGVQFERWQASQSLGATASQDEILAAYAEPVARLKQAHGFQSADVVSLRPDHPDRVALRNKFLSEHTHTDYEVRFFIEGQGVFYLHHDAMVYVVCCTRGDLISVPANTRHWFDMGEAPDFKCIRLFTTPEGWVADYTGDDIATRYPRFEAITTAVAA